MVKPRLGDITRSLYLLMVVCTVTAAYSNTSLRWAVHHDLALQSQSINKCWNTSNYCSTNYIRSTINFTQTVCDTGSYVYQFIVTSGRSLVGGTFVNKLELTCSNGKTISQGDSPTTVSYITQIMNASGFSMVELHPGCIVDRMRIGGINVGNKGYGSAAVSCGCPAGSLIVGLPFDTYEPIDYTSFATFGIVCDNNFCLKGQYYSDGHCISCPTGK